MARSLWVVVQGNPKFMQHVNGWLTIFWVLMIPLSVETGWVKSVTYVSALSLWALVSGHWATWQAARVEVTQQSQIDAEKAHPIEERVVEKMVEDTDVASDK